MVTAVNKASNKKEWKPRLDHQLNRISSPSCDFSDSLYRLFSETSHENENDNSESAMELTQLHTIQNRSQTLNI